MEHAADQYLRWHYEPNVWKQLAYRGVRTLKLPLDMWNYQEIIFEHDLHWVLETGTRHGGSALYFADLEDTIVNGHPVRPEFGPGPLEAVEGCLRQNPGRLVADMPRETKFGCTFAYRGYHKVAALPDRV
jgi:cephalosporin hydroxylase